MIILLEQEKNKAIIQQRVFACTEAMVRQYLDDLAEELIWTGIFTNAKQIELGVWTGSIDTSCTFNHDEVPQLIDYGVCVCVFISFHRRGFS